MCGITGLVLWDIMLGIIEKNGSKAEYTFYGSPRAYMDLNRIINSEKNPAKKKKYKLVFWSQIMLLPIYIIGGFLIIFLNI